MRTAVAARVPSDGQADGRAAIVALAIAVCVHMVCVFLASIALQTEQVFARLCWVSLTLDHLP